MKPKQSVLQDARRVKLAIGSARDYAESRGVPITLERLAVCLGVCSRQILEFAGSDEDELDDASRKSQALLCMACEEIAAAHVEHGMTKGNNSTMDVLMLKTHFGYGDKAESEPAESGPAVVFVGEENLPE